MRCRPCLLACSRPYDCAETRHRTTEFSTRRFANLVIVGSNGLAWVAKAMKVPYYQ